MNWQQALICLAILIIAVAIFAGVLEHMDRRECRRSFRITPKFTVGSDAK